MEPGTYIEFTKEKKRTNTYWDIEFNRDKEFEDENEWIKKFDETFTSAIDRRLLSGEYGLLLSGGLDSTAIGCVLRRRKKDFCLFH